MRLVDKPTLKPLRCAVVPFLGPSSENVRWIDTGCELDRERVYLSDHAVRECIRTLGWPDPDEHEGLRAELNASRARVEELEAELVEADRFASAIDVIESREFRARKKAGRPKTKSPEGAAA